MEPKSTNQRSSVAAILLIVLMVFVTSCANSEKSAQRVTDADNMMQQIEEVEAMDYASEAFSEAQIRLEEARQFREQGKHKKAMLKADEAMAAAELAEVKTLSEKAKGSLSDLKQRIQSLKDQLKQYRQDQ
ncbi:MAG: DUF4398 domain-containing protein [Fodinibius sp.]|nr:DUF4398 domain-containing protein [Fodinibius sp.]